MLGITCQKHFGTLEVFADLLKGFVKDFQAFLGDLSADEALNLLNELIDLGGDGTTFFGQCTFFSVIGATFKLEDQFLGDQFSYDAGDLRTVDTATLGKIGSGQSVLTFIELTKTECVGARQTVFAHPLCFELFKAFGGICDQTAECLKSGFYVV